MQHNSRPRFQSSTRELQRAIANQPYGKPVEHGSEAGMNPKIPYFVPTVSQLADPQREIQMIAITVDKDRVAGSEFDDRSCRQILGKDGIGDPHFLREKVKQLD